MSSECLSRCRTRGTIRNAAIIPIRQIGTFRKKIARHVTSSVKMPPSSGPATTPSPATAPHTPTAWPRSSGGNMWVISANVCGSSIAAPIPCTIRKAISRSALFASPQMSEAVTNTARPLMNRFFGPSISPSRPNVISRTANASTYALTIHRVSASDAWRWLEMLGRATVTIEVSSTVTNVPSARMMRMTQRLT